MLEHIIKGFQAAKDLSCLLDNLKGEAKATVASVKKNGIVLDELKKNGFKPLKDK